MREQNWNHRTELQGASDPALKTVTANVNERRDGPTLGHQETKAYLNDVDLPGQEPEEAAEEPERRLRQHFHPRHIPEGWEEEPKDERSNREKLLEDGHISVNKR